MFSKATFEGVVVYPGILGGSNWSPVSLDEADQRVFVSGIHAPIKYPCMKVLVKMVRAIRYAASEPTSGCTLALCLQ
jgi:hypothetical protein